MCVCVQAGASGAPLEPLRPAQGYMGLRNGGATCYMNSVLQQLFMQPRIRALVLGCPPTPPEEAAGSVFAQLQVRAPQRQLCGFVCDCMWA